MSNPFFDHPILNSPYEYPMRHWELDEAGQPTQKIVESRRRAEFITPIPKPKKRKAHHAIGICVRRRQGAFDRKSSNTTPPRSSMKFAIRWTNGGTCPIPMNGR